MKTHSYAFGDHTLFLRQKVYSHRMLELAFKDPNQIGVGLIYVYEDAEYCVGYDMSVGGRLVLVIEFSPWINRVIESKKPWTKRPGGKLFEIFDRYIRFVIYCRSKEQK